MAETSDLASHYRSVRAASELLCEPLSPEDSAIQSMPDASPAKWHLAHTSWFFEVMVLEPRLADYRVFHPQYGFLFNSYYESVGERHPRPQRGMLSRPPLSEVLAYRAHVDDGMHRLLADGAASDPRLARLIQLGLHHEQQHQELLLTDVKHMLSLNPLAPVYRELSEPAAAEVKPLAWHGYAEGVRWIGHDGEGFAFDNECPRHRTFTAAFELASRLVTNGEFLAFMADDGYERPDLWLSDGWTRLLESAERSPLYWRRDGDGWQTFTLGGLRELRPDEPVCHVSFYEADAFARWYGARLPSEAEWETAASEAAPTGHFIESGHLHPAPAQASGEHPAQLFGDCWEWTQSSYAPYPGYQPPDGALGEYNAKFMCNQMTLRGGSCATPGSHVRASYRNFFYPDARWQFSGIRLARDVG